MIGMNCTATVLALVECGADRRRQSTVRADSIYAVYLGGDDDLTQ